MVVKIMGGGKEWRVSHGGWHIVSRFSTINSRTVSSIANQLETHLHFYHWRYARIVAIWIYMNMCQRTCPLDSNNLFWFVLFPQTPTVNFSLSLSKRNPSFVFSTVNLDNELNIMDERWAPIVTWSLPSHT
mgnify:CR=1 FL=1